ncbi:MAG TPA: hypothetical protein P5084_08100 [Paludibacter sp.]|nr:hypothetical protein [Paludibacter sp.]
MLDETIYLLVASHQTNYSLFTIFNCRQGLRPLTELRFFSTLSAIRRTLTAVEDKSIQRQTDRTF